MSLFNKLVVSQNLFIFVSNCSVLSFQGTTTIKKYSIKKN